MAPMDPSGLLFTGSLQPTETNFSWGAPSSCLYNVKSEAGVLPSPALNTSSSSESCMASTCQGINQRTYTYYSTSLAPHTSNESFSAVVPDSAGLGDLNQAQSAKCDYSTVTSAQRDESFLSQMQMESLAMRYSPNASGTAGWNSALSQASSMCGDLQSVITGDNLRGGACVLQQAPASILGGASAASLKSESLPLREKPGVRRTISGQAFRCFTPEVSEDASLDALLPSSSTVSSTTGSVGPDQDDDDTVCTTSDTEPKQFVNISSPGVVGTGIVLSPAQDEQQISGAPKEGGNAHSADQVEMNSTGSLILSAQMANSLGDESWCLKVKEDSSVGLCFAEPAPNLMNAGGAIATPAVDPATSYMMPNIYRTHDSIHNLAALNIATNALTNNKPACSMAIAEDNMVRDSLTHAMLFRSAFPAAIDLAAVENSRPKRRNVKISKDPQSVAARHRRERISDRIRVLQRLVPGGTKMDTASMLDEAIHYVKFLKEQVQTLESVSNAAATFDPVGRLGFTPSPFFRNSNLPFRQMSNDSLGLTAATEHGFYGAGSPFLPHPSADAFREQFCH